MKPIDNVILIITASVCIFLLGILAAVVITGSEISNSAFDKIDHMITGLIAIISIYVGSKTK